MAKTLLTMIDEVRGACKDLDDMPLVNVWFDKEFTSQSRRRTIPAHRTGATTCTVLPFQGTSHKYERNDGVVVTDLRIRDRDHAYTYHYRSAQDAESWMTRVQWCTDCFGQKGIAEVIASASQDTAHPGLKKFLMRHELVTLRARCEHVRAGVVSGRIFGKKETPVVLRKVARAQEVIAAFDTEQRQEHLAAIENFEESAQKLIALVNPQQSTYALDRLAALFTTPNHPWANLDKTPTLLAIERGVSWRVNQVDLAPELIAALRVSPEPKDDLVLYGPRYAIDYVQRAHGVTPAYIATTTEQDAEVARLTGGIWGVHDGIPDLFTAIETARNMLAT